MKPACLSWLLMFGFLLASNYRTLRAQVPPELEKALSFYCAFDGSLEPALHKGEGTFHESLWPFFVRGHRGAAYVTGHRRNVRYSCSSNLNIEQGTVAFWVSPLNWQSTDAGYHHFFAVPDETGTQKAKDEEIFSFLLYKFPDWNELLAYGMDGQLTAYTMLRLPLVPEWRTGEWHQVVFGWDKQGAALYTDGEGFAMRYTRAAPRRAGSREFQLGGPYFVGNLSLTAIDDLYIFDRRLTKAEIKELYRVQSKN